MNGISGTFPKSVRPERSAEGAKSKGQVPGKNECFDFAELRSATLNMNGFGQAVSIAGQTRSMKAWCMGIASTQVFTTWPTLAMKPARSRSGIWSTSGW